MHSNNNVTPWEQIKYSSKSFKGKFENTMRKTDSTIEAKVKREIEDLSKDCENLKEEFINLKAVAREQAKSLLKSAKDKVQDAGKNPINIETKRKYEIEDLPEFFKQRSKKIGQIFSDEVVEISTIRSRSITSNTQEFSFKLKLLTAEGENAPDTILPQIKHLIVFFKIYLLQEESFKTNIKVPKESEELCNNYYNTDDHETVEEFISNAPTQILLHGITIMLQTDIKNINLDSLQQIEIFLNEQLKHVEKAKSGDQNQDTLQVEETENKNENVVEKGNTQDKQIV